MSIELTDLSPKRSAESEENPFGPGTRIIPRVVDEATQEMGVDQSIPQVISM